MMPMLRQPSFHSPDHVRERIHALYGLHSNGSRQRKLIRSLMRGGREAVEAVFGSDTKLKDEHLPAANMLHAGMMRLGQMIGQVPTVKSTPPPNRDSQAARDNADLIGRLVLDYDESSKMELKLPRVSRWIAGYGFGFMFVTAGRDPYTNKLYPKVRIKSSYDVFPGYWSDDEEPDEVAVIRAVDPVWLAKRYPAYAQARNLNRERTSSGAVILGAGAKGYGVSAFEGVGPNMVAIAHYFDETGQYLWVEDTGQLLSFSPNPLPVKNFICPRRIDFDDTMGQWDHAIGVFSMAAKLNVLGFIAAEDTVFAETNIIGDPTNSTYKRGRNAINRFPPNTQVQRGVNTGNLQQTFAQIDRLERQLRIAANYPVSMDGQSPNSFATGQGIEKLQSAADANVKEYQNVLARAMIELDAIRLCWDETMYAGAKKALEPRVSADATTEYYDPAKIKGRYRTDRVYGVMAGWDDSTKIVGGLQLLAAGIIDRRTMRENMDGLRDPALVDDRIAEEAAFDTAFSMLEQRAAQGDPTAANAVVKILRDPTQRLKILSELFEIDEEEMAAQQQAAMAGVAGPGGGGGAPPDITTILSQLGSGGQVEGGAQTVARV